MIFFDDDKKKELFVKIFTLCLEGDEEKVRELLVNLTGSGLQDFEYTCRQLARIAKEL